MTRAERRIEKILDFETPNGPRDSGCLALALPILTATMSLSLLALRAPELSFFWTAFCTTPSFLLGLSILAAHRYHDTRVKHLLHNARNHAVPDLPKPYIYGGISPDSLKLFNQMRRDLYPESAPEDIQDTSSTL